MRRRTAGISVVARWRRATRFSDEVSVLPHAPRRRDYLARSTGAVDDPSFRPATFAGRHLLEQLAATLERARLAAPAHLLELVILGRSRVARERHVRRAPGGLIEVGQRVGAYGTTRAAETER